ncbi:MAG TPA: Dam family site-specific DNA-(adenine-N6)-methyltransferase [Candidatus Angelobacter sp.]
MANRRPTPVEPVEANCPPLLKWPGGKRNLLDTILPLVPTRFNRYFEPFLGGGALFFALQPKKAYLSDKNAELIQTYLQVRDRPELVIRELRKLRNTERDYYRIRSSAPRSSAAQAARLIYLVTLAFNGIYRVNLKGEFNVPYGYKTHLNPGDEERIHTASKVLRNAVVKDNDFAKALNGATTGDLVYLDPPYTVAHRNNGFIKYNAKIFSWEDQLRLAQVARECVAKGCFVIISNADHFSIHKLYEGFAIKRIERNSIIAASSDFRSRVTECIFYAGGLNSC